MIKRRQEYPFIDVAKILLSPVTVRINDVVKKLDPFEAQLETCVARALKQDIAACERFVKLCLREGLIVKPVPFDDFRSMEVIPKDWDWDGWEAMYEKHGSPPWPGPRDGLTTEEREKWQATQRRRNTKRTGDR